MDPEELDYAVEARPELTILSVRGEIDLANAERLAEALAEVSEAGRPVVVDASELAFIDSAVFAAIHRAVEQAALHLVVPPDCPTARAFGVSGLAEVMPVHESLGAASEAASSTS